MRTPLTNREIFNLQHGLCFVCRNPMKRRRGVAQGWTADHFYPRSRGFTFADGKTLAHKRCNERKADGIPGRKLTRRYVAIFGAPPPGLEKLKDIDPALYAKVSESLAKALPASRRIWPVPRIEPATITNLRAAFIAAGVWA